MVSAGNSKVAAGLGHVDAVLHKMTGSLSLKARLRQPSSRAIRRHTEGGRLHARASIL